MRFPRITFKKRKLSVNPDPIIVRRGDEIELELYADISDFSINELLKFSRIKWTLYFDNGNPFYPGQKVEKFKKVSEKRYKAPIFAERMLLPKAELIGEYKYGITLSKAPEDNDDDSAADNYHDQENVENEEVIEDIDPIIIVTE